MPVSPENFISLAVENLRDLIALCPTWHAWTGVSGTDQEKFDASRLRTHPVEEGIPSAGHREPFEADEIENRRPMIVVDTLLDPTLGGGFRLVRIANDYMREAGTLFMRIEADVPEDLANDEASAKIDFVNRLGGLMREMANFANHNGRLDVSKMETDFEVVRSDNTQRATQGDYMSTVVRVHYGRV